MSGLFFYSILTVLICVIGYFIFYKRRLNRAQKFSTVIEVALRQQKLSVESATYLTKLYELNDQELNEIADKLRIQMAIKALLKYQMATNSQQKESSDKKEQ